MLRSVLALAIISSVINVRMTVSASVASELYPVPVVVPVRHSRWLRMPFPSAQVIVQRSAFVVSSAFHAMLPCVIRAIRHQPFRYRPKKFPGRMREFPRLSRARPLATSSFMAPTPRKSRVQDRSWYPSMMPMAFKVGSKTQRGIGFAAGDFRSPPTGRSR